MKTQAKKGHTRIITEENTIEAARHVSSEVVNDLKDVGKATVNELWESLLLNRKRVFSGDLREGEEISLLDSKEDKSTEAPRKAEAAIDYFREIVQGDKRVAHEDEQSIRTQVSEIQIEIKRLIESTKDLKVQFTQVVVEQNVEKPGKYHKTYYEWLLSMLVNWRQNVEDAGAWMAALSSKKTSRKYWNMFKKHGTTFGLSGERNVSTQTG